MRTFTAPAWATRAVPGVVATFGGFATVATLVALQNAGAPLWAVNAAMLVPGVVTALVVPTSRRRWYRWVTILALAQVVNPWATAPLLLVATSWALWRSWSVERVAPGPHGAAHLPPVKRTATPRGAR
jgi:hypothetical protein